MSTRQELRSLIAGDPFMAAECYSALSARIIEDVGFPAAYMGGHGTSMMHYAIPDNGVFTPTEMIEQAGRVVMLQFWRNLGPARMDHPVAFCDSRTVTPAEVQPFRYQGYVAGGRAFDALAVLAPERPSHHAWYVYPDLTPSEVVVFRTYDTELVDRNETWFTPHSAFRDPTVADGQGWRFSIELRAMCLFD